jgi:hypothetical protein
VWGANHNYYDSEWQLADAGGGGTITGCINHTPLFAPSAFGSPEQRETGRFAAAAFFTANVGRERDPAANAVSDPAFPLPVPERVNRDIPNTPVSFQMELVNADDSRSSPVSIDEFVELLPPPRSSSGRTLQTLRIPLDAFAGAELDGVRAVRLTFTTPFDAGILVTSLRATVDTTGLGALDAPSTRARVASSALTTPSVDAASASEPERVDTGNAITSVVSRGAEVEITLTSSRFFDLRARELVLSIGAERSGPPRHPGGDLRTAQFLLPRSAFERLGAIEPIRVDYGASSPIVWDFGTFDKTRPDR